MHGCLQHVYAVDGWYNGRCHCGCLISPRNLRKMLKNMEAGRSRAKSLLYIDGVCIGATRWKTKCGRPRKTEGR